MVGSGKLNDMFGGQKGFLGVLRAKLEEIFAVIE